MIGGFGMPANEMMLGEICVFLAGSAFPKNAQGNSAGDYPFIKVSDMNLPKNSRHIISAKNWISTAKASDLKVKLHPRNSIVFAKIGEALKAERLRILASNTAIDNNMMVAIPKEPVNPYYLFLLLETVHLASYAEGSALPYLRQQDLEQIQVNVPPLYTQKKIVQHIKNIDDKIELNNQINDYLEQLGYALYRQFFVNTESNAWVKGTLSDIGNIIGGATPSKAKSEYYTNEGIAWITPRDLSINKSKFISHGETDITPLGLKNSSARLLPSGTVLFSSRAPIGYIAIANGEVATNQGFKSVIPKARVGTAFVYYFLKDNLNIIEGMASGSTFREVSGAVIKNIPVAIPSNKILASFNEKSRGIFQRQLVLEQESNYLAVLRDTLLPKLMSGEIDVSQVEI
jgi:type I restriction enzyme S subunit